MFYPPDVNSELDRALYSLKKIVLEGLDHGYFGSYPKSAIEVERFQMQQVAVGVGLPESPIHLIL